MLLIGDAREKLKEIPDKTVQLILTSPPYWKQRSYLPEEHPDKALELGQEPDPGEYVHNLVTVCREFKRVLRDDGCFFLNLGDSYIGGGKAGKNPEYQRHHKEFGRPSKHKQRFAEPTGVPIGYKRKDLAAIPWDTAMALRDDGWYLRSGIPWLKNSGMPESCEDRPSSAVEYFFMFSKAEHYFYDHWATRLPGAIPAGTKAAKGSIERYRQNDVNARPPEYKEYDGMRNRRNTDWFVDSIRGILEGKSGTLLHDEKGLPIAIFCNPQPYKGAHFATFSPRLITPIILAATSLKACEHCGMPWQLSEVETGHKNQREPAYVPENAETKTDSTGWKPTKVPTGEREPRCSCPNEGKGKSIVLDPFMGSGTTAMVAEQHGRDWIGIELNPECGKMVEKRLRGLQLKLLL